LHHRTQHRHPRLTPRCPHDGLRRIFKASTPSAPVPQRAARRPRLRVVVGPSAPGATASRSGRGTTNRPSWGQRRELQPHTGPEHRVCEPAGGPGQAGERARRGVHQQRTRVLRFRAGTYRILRSASANRLLHPVLLGLGGHATATPLGAPVRVGHSCSSITTPSPGDSASGRTVTSPFRCRGNATPISTSMARRTGSRRRTWSSALACRSALRAVRR
jgi:hypothetical protein